jgi:beta-glucosidase
VVFGEEPYAEFLGDRPDHALHDEEGLNLLRRFKAAHVPAVAVLLSGRPLWVNRELALADAFVAAWLPGSEGAGVADVLVGDALGKPRSDFTGRLSFHWPADCLDHAPPLMPVGGGGDYASPPRPPRPSESCAALLPDSPDLIAVFRRALGPGVTAIARVGEAQAETPLPGLLGHAPGGSVAAAALDFAAQEDGRRLQWTASGDIVLRLGRALSTARGELAIEYAIDQPVRLPVTLGGDCDRCRSAIDLSAGLGQGWRTVRIPLRCLGPAPLTALRFHAAGPTVVRLASATITPVSPASAARCEAVD